MVKVGGGDDLDVAAICDDVARQVAAGLRLVLVHGGNRELSRVSTALGRPPRFVTSVSGIESRLTDDDTMNDFTMVYAGRVNKTIVAALQARRVNAIGLCGADGGLLRGPEKGALRVRELDGRERVIRGDRSGRVESVNRDLLMLLLESGYTPVISPPALSHQGRLMNVDGDRAAASVALALGADQLIILTDRPGLLRDPSDEDSLVRSLGVDELDRAMELAQGRMRIKVLAAREALAGGVKKVCIGDGRAGAPVAAILAGAGTVIH
ncbi:MAG: [LysW]-aminoadipate kinase [Candidatus Dormibacteria bacterium]